MTLLKNAELGVRTIFLLRISIPKRLIIIGMYFDCPKCLMTEYYSVKDLTPNPC